MPPVRNDTTTAEGGYDAIAMLASAAAGTARTPDMPVPKQQDTQAAHDAARLS